MIRPPLVRLLLTSDSTASAEEIREDATLRENPECKCSNHQTNHTCSLHVFCPSGSCP